MKVSPVPPAIQDAFNEVKKYHPEVCIVSYNTYGCWNFTDVNFDHPKEWSHLIDIGVLEAAMESLSEFPAIFELFLHENH